VIPAASGDTLPPRLSPEGKRERGDPIPCCRRPIPLSCRPRELAGNLSLMHHPPQRFRAAWIRSPHSISKWFSPPASPSSPNVHPFHGAASSSTCRVNSRRPLSKQHLAAAHAVRLASDWPCAKREPRLMPCAARKYGDKRSGVERKLALRINITPLDKPAGVAPATIILLTKGEATSALFLQVQQFKRPTLRLPPKKKDTDQATRA